MRLSSVRYAINQGCLSGDIVYEDRKRMASTDAIIRHAIKRVLNVSCTSQETNSLFRVNSTHEDLGAYSNTF